MTQQVMMVDQGWSEPILEHAGKAFVCGEGQVLIGRSHVGDDTGPTRYRTAKLMVEGRQVQVVVDQDWHELHTEDGPTFHAEVGKVIVGREHSGDEMGPTRYLCATVLVDGRPARVSDPRWSAEMSETDSEFTAEQGRVLVGRRHTGDETGPTAYLTAQLSID